MQLSRLGLVRGAMCTTTGYPSHVFGRALFKDSDITVIDCVSLEICVDPHSFDQRPSHMPLNAGHPNGYLNRDIHHSKSAGTTQANTFIPPLSHLETVGWTMLGSVQASRSSRPRVCANTSPMLIRKHGLSIVYSSAFSILHHRHNSKVVR